MILFVSYLKFLVSCEETYNIYNITIYRRDYVCIFIQTIPTKNKKYSKNVCPYDIMTVQYVAGIYCFLV